MNFEYLDIPSLPEHLVASVYASMLSENVSMQNSSNYFYHKVSDDIDSWIRENVNLPIHMIRVQKMTGDINPHIDNNPKLDRVNYLIEDGGSAITSFYKCKPGYYRKQEGFIPKQLLLLTESYKIETRRWHRLNVSNIHGVTEIKTDRISLTISTEKIL